MRAILASVLVLLVPLVAPSAPALDAGVAAAYTVAASNFEWTPESLAIAPGDSVEFVNNGGAHTWELADGSDPCDLPCLKTFSEEATIDYRCGIHTSMTGSIVVGLAPVVTIATPAPGSVVSGLLQVTGAASHPSSGIASVSVRLATGAPVAATLSGNGTSVTWSAEVPTTSLANGAATLVATATTQNSLTGSTSIGVTIDNPLTIDLAVASLSAQQGAIDTNTIAFTIDNEGNAASGPFTVLAEYLYHGSWRVIGATTLASIPLGGSGTGQIVWDPAVPHVGAFQVRVTADPDALLPDPARANNVATTTAGWVTSALPGVIVTEP